MRFISLLFLATAFQCFALTAATHNEYVEEATRLADATGGDPEAIDSLLYDFISRITDPVTGRPDEQRYAWFLEGFLVSEAIPESGKLRPRILLEDLRRNAPGEIAADIPLTTADGTETTLLTIPSEGDILMIFYDPECDDCLEARQQIASNPDVRDAEEQGRLTVLAIYAGEDAVEWEKTKDTMPDGWLSAWDGGAVDAEESYTLPYTPTIYLLGHDRRIKARNLHPSAISAALR